MQHSQPTDEQGNAFQQKKGKEEILDCCANSAHSAPCLNYWMCNEVDRLSNAF